MKMSTTWKIAGGIAAGLLGAWLLLGQLARLAADDLRRQSANDARRAEQARVQQNAVDQKAHGDRKANPGR
jgi:hypothetical protein